MSEKPWQIRKFYTADDFQKVSQLRKSFSESKKSSERRTCEPEYYRWKLQDNPVKEGMLHVADDKGKVVGMVSITPKQFFAHGQLRNGAEIGDTFTHQHYQHQGIFTNLVNSIRDSAMQQGNYFIYGTPNNNSLPGYENKCNFSIIPSVNAFNLVLPLNIGSVLRAKINSPIMVLLLGPLLKLGFKMLYSVKSPQLEERDVKFSFASSFPDDISSLCAKVSKNYDWILARSKLYLNWRFILNPDNYSIIVAENSHETLGYIVMKIGYWQKLKVGYLADFLVDEKEPEIFTALVLHSLKLFQKNNVDMLACWAVEGGVYHDILKKYGFKKHKKVPIICYKTTMTTKIINDAGKWHFTMADSDNI